jgi:tetratricopeptide (TPR) repeat protein
LASQDKRRAIYDDDNFGCILTPMTSGYIKDRPSFVFLRYLLFAALFLVCSRGAYAAEEPEKHLTFGRPDLIRPDQKADEAFLREASSKYPNREAASRAFASLGWTQLREGKAEPALQSFYRAWLLNAKNYQAFWGYGAILADRGNLLDAIEQLDTARELMDDPKQIPALLVDMGTVNSTYAAGLPKDKQLDRAQYFVRANQCFVESLELDPTYAAGWRAWALSLYDQERYSEAAIKAQRAQELKAEPLPANFWRDLKKNMAGEKQ